MSLGTAACGSSPPATTPPLPPVETRGYQVSDPVPPDSRDRSECGSDHAPTTARFERVGDEYELVVTIGELPDAVVLKDATVVPKAVVRVERGPGTAVIRAKPQRLEQKATIRIPCACEGTQWTVAIDVTWTDPDVIANAELPVTTRTISP